LENFFTLIVTILSAIKLAGCMARAGAGEAGHLLRSPCVY
jgi:hypothetical protein